MKNCACCTSKYVVYNFVDSCSTSSKSSSSSKGIGEGGAGKGGNTAAGPGRNWGVGSGHTDCVQAGDKGDCWATEGATTRLCCDTRPRLTAAKPGCEAAKVGRRDKAAEQAAGLQRQQNLCAAEREAWAFPNTLISEAVDEVACVVVTMLWLCSVKRRKKRAGGRTRHKESYGLCIDSSRRRSRTA